MTVAELAMEVVEALQQTIQSGHNDALRRQIASNIEFEIKLSCLEKLDEAVIEPFVLSDGSWNEMQVKHVALEKLLQMLTESDRKAVMTEWLGGEQNYAMFCTAMRKLKGFSANGAHPTETLDHKPIDAEMAKQLVDEKMPAGPIIRRRRKQPSSVPQWTDAQLKGLVKKCIDKLVSVRLEHGDEKFL